MGRCLSDVMNRMLTLQCQADICKMLMLSGSSCLKWPTPQARPDFPPCFWFYCVYLWQFCVLWPPMTSLKWVQQDSKRVNMKWWMCAQRCSSESKLIWENPCSHSALDIEKLLTAMKTLPQFIWVSILYVGPNHCTGCQWQSADTAIQLHSLHISHLRPWASTVCKSTSGSVINLLYPVLLGNCPPSQSS